MQELPEGDEYATQPPSGPHSLLEIAFISIEPYGFFRTIHRRPDYATGSTGLHFTSRGRPSGSQDGPDRYSHLRDHV